MYAVIKTGGKQYKVSPGDVIEVEHLKVKGDHDDLTLSPLLVVTDQGNTLVGAQQLKEFPVSAKVLGDIKGDKVTVFKYRPKSGYASKRGHRQLYSLIQITAIGEAKASELKTAEDVQPETTGPQKPAPPPESKEPSSEAAGDEGASEGTEDGSQQTLPEAAEQASPGGEASHQTPPSSDEGASAPRGERPGE